MITVTESAAEGLLATLREKGLQGRGLRLSVERGGCAGLQYSMELAEPSADDLVIEAAGGAQFFVERSSLAHLEGCTLDYCDDLTGAGFRVINPRAARSCGCGTSFEPSAA